MKQFCAIAAVLTIASSAPAGVIYKIQSATTGVQAATISGTVTIDGSHTRMDIATGDNTLFKDNDIVISNDGGRTMSIYDPASRTYFDLQLDQILSTSTAMLDALGGMVKVSFNNPHVAINDAGDGGTVEGYPTRKYVLDASYDIVINAMGQKMTTHFTMNTESWNTDQLSSDLTNFLQTRGIRTGIEGLDKVIEAQQNGMRGFPLKQVSTVNMNDMVMSTTSSVRDIQRRAIDASQFTPPSGYSKVDDPITRMVKQLKQ
jgi:hypothetical protein